MVARIHVRQGPDVAGALDIVLAAQWVDAGGRLSQVAGDHGQVGEAEDVVCPCRVLGDPHAVYNRGTFGRRVHPRGEHDVGAGDTRDALHPLGGVGGDHRAHVLAALGPCGHELLVLQALGKDDVEDAVYQGDVGARAMAQPQLGETYQIYLSRVSHDEGGPVLLHCRLDLQADDGMCLGGVGADDEHAVGVAQFRDGVGHGAGSEGHR